MTVLVFNRKRLLDRPLHRWLADSRSRVVLVTSRESLDGHPVASLRERYRHVEPVETYEACSVETRAAELAERYAVRRIASASEDDVLRAARLRHRLGLPGQQPESAVAYRDKLRMKELVRAAGLATPDFAPVRDGLDLLAFVDRHGLPVVVKPRRGSGSVDVHILRDRTAVARLLGSGALPVAPARPDEWMVERFVDGTFHHVDGITAGGRVLHCWASRYSSGNAESLQRCAPWYSRLLGADDPRRRVLQEFAARVHAALPAPPCPTSFHLEAWLDAADRPVLCEVACRAGGALVVPGYEAAFGVSLSTESLRGQAGDRVSLDSQPAHPRIHTGWMIVPPREGVLELLGDGRPTRGTTVTFHVRPGERSGPAEYAGQAAIAALVTGAAPAEVDERLAEVGRWCSERVRWR